MTHQTQGILDAALALPEAERLLLLERLLDKVSTAEDELSGDELFAELRRRRAEVRAGAVEGVPWSKLKDY
jgi:putative addiction module component (TIGR02574 family)